MRDQPDAALLSLLERERIAISAGQLTEIAKLETEKAALVDAIRGQGVDRKQLAALSAAFAHNARLLAAAIRGIKSAQTRLAALAAVRDGLSVYSATGKRQTVADQRSAFERKA